MSRRIIIDTDPGIDDAMAIYFALGSPDLDVVALTTVFGNVHTPQATANALSLLEIAGRDDIPVHEGAHVPLVGTFVHSAAVVHGDDGLGDAATPPPAGRSASPAAPEFLVETVMAAEPGTLTLVALGPLTNVALAMQAEPAFGGRLAELVVMGGSVHAGGNVTPAAEANIFHDPEAADVVFGAACPVTMVGLDVTSTAVMTGADLERMGTLPGPRAEHLARIVPCYARFHAARLGLDGVCLHDPTTISYLLAPDAFEWIEHPVRVDTGSSVARGATIAGDTGPRDWAGWAHRPAVRVLTRVDLPRVVELELELTAG